MEKLARPKVLCVVGPTACGKTDLALALALELGGEIISADSRQIYRGLDAGTAKPPRDSNGLACGIPYHLLDIRDPAQPFDAGSFMSLARQAARDILGRGRTPILAGGTGLYIKVFLKGLSPMPPKNEDVRARLENLGRKNGRGFLHALLAQRDPEAAAKIPANNIQRTVRALEVLEVSGSPISRLWKKSSSQEPVFDALTLNIEWPAQELRGRISGRCRAMWPGILEEVRKLVPGRYDGTEPGFQSLGYPQALAVLREDIPAHDGLELFIKDTLAYAKRQRTWFRRQQSCVPIAGGQAADMARQALPMARDFLGMLPARGERAS